MRGWLARALIAALPFCIASVASAAHKPAPELAITFDDLPLHGPIPPGETTLGIAQRVIAALRAGHVGSVTGFVNGRWTETYPITSEALLAWSAAGLPLGNHSWSHANLNDVTAVQYEQEIDRNGPLLARVASRSDWHWFRFPYLAEGDDPAKRAEIRSFLAKRGYRIAAVTMDFGDWRWTTPYARCLAERRDEQIAALKKLYLQSARESITFYRTLSHELYGRDIPYVLLMHIGALDSHMLPQLIALYRHAGFRFVSLAEAERDPVYREDVDPSLPARLASLEGRAMAKGFKLPEHTDFEAKLAAICPAPIAAPAPSAPSPPPSASHS